MIKVQRTEFLDSIRGLAITMVVIIHAAGYVSGELGIYNAIISLGLHSIAVPIFFAVDGYLFKKKSWTLNVQSTYVKSFRRLFVPWIIFSLAYLLFRYYAEYLSILESNYAYKRSLSHILLNIYYSVYSAQLYFLPALFLIRLIAPISRKIAQCKSSFTLITITIIYIFIFNLLNESLFPNPFVKNGLDPFIHFLWGYQYYLLGMVIYNFRNAFNNGLSAIPIFLCTSIFFLVLSIYSDSPILFFQISYLFLLFALFMRLNINTSYFTLTSKYMMGIFLLHAPIGVKFGSLLIEKITSAPIANILLTTLIAIIFSLVVTRILLLSKYTRWTIGE